MKMFLPTELQRPNISSVFSSAYFYLIFVRLWSLESLLFWYVAIFDSISGLEEVCKEINTILFAIKLLYQKDIIHLFFQWKIGDQRQISIYIVK